MMYSHQTYMMIGMFIPNDTVLPKKKHFLDIQINDAETEIYITIDYKKVETVNKEVSVFPEKRLERLLWCINRIQKYEIPLYFENKQEYGINTHFIRSHKVNMEEKIQFADKLGRMMNVLKKDILKNKSKIITILELQAKLVILIEKENSKYLLHTCPEFLNEMRLNM